MTNEEYHALPGINASFLKACSYGAYQGWKHLYAPRVESDAMAFGSAVHCALLEPHLFLSQFAIATEKFDKRTKAGKEGSAAFEAANTGKTIIDSDDATKIELIRKRCGQIKAVKDALGAFEKEKTIIFNGDSCRARLDLVDMENGVVIDVKTTRDANPREFINQCLSLRYDIQLLHYCKAANATTAYAIAIESESAEVALYDLTDIVFSDFTKNRYENAYAIALEVQKMTVCPPKFKPEIINLTLPAWVKESA